MTASTLSFPNALRIFAALLALPFLAACEPTAGMRSARAVDASAPVKVALLVPTGSGQGELDFLGQSLANAARLAERDITGANVSVTVYPTGGDAARAAAAASQAIADGAQVFVGPLFSTAAAAVGPVAAQNGLQVLSFSNNAEIAGGNVYVLGVTFQDVASRVVRHAVANGNRDVAIIHSADAGGLAGRTAAQTAVRNAGGIVTGAFPYELTPQGISTAAPDIARDVRASGSTAALFTDDPASGLTFLAPVLASNGLNSSDVQFLGLTRWNVPAEAAATPSLQGGVFAAPDPGIANQFESRYIATYGSTPHALAGLAYDGVAAVGAMVGAAQTSGGGALTRGQITDPNGFAGVNGIFRFLPNGQNQRGLALYQLRDGQAVLIEAAPRSFGGGV